MRKQVAFVCGLALLVCSGISKAFGQTPTP